MPISVIVAILLLLALAYVFWYASRRGRGIVQTLSQAVAGTLTACAALLFLGAVTAAMFGGRPFGLEILKHPYEVWVQRFEHPTQPLVRLRANDEAQV